MALLKANFYSTKQTSTVRVLRIIATSEDSQRGRALSLLAAFCCPSAPLGGYQVTRFYPVLQV